jgi:hypothetical protein
VVQEIETLFPKRFIIGQMSCQGIVLNPEAPENDIANAFWPIPDRIGNRSTLYRSPKKSAFPPCTVTERPSKTFRYDPPIKSILCVSHPCDIFLNQPFYDKEESEEKPAFA